MKKIAFVLAVLLFATPALALVRIDANHIGEGQVEIQYFTDGNLPRAFGLDITVNYGEISSCTPYMVGECNDVLRGYGIFPSTIEIDVGGNVTNYGNPVSDVEPALGGIDTNGLTVEMGSLYVGTYEPYANGLLCTITVTANCTVSIAGNAARCGTGSEALGVVMEDPDEVPVVEFGDANVIIDCFPTAHPDYAEWVAVGKPDCWCYPSQCYGDADGTLHGTMIGGYFWVGIPDLDILTAAWRVKEPPKGPGIDSVLNGICADFDHVQHGTMIGGYFRVGIPDLDILTASWRVKEPPKGPGILADCLD